MSVALNKLLDYVDDVKKEFKEGIYITIMKYIKEIHKEIPPKRDHKCVVLFRIAEPHFYRPSVDNELVITIKSNIERLNIDLTSEEYIKLKSEIDNRGELPYISCPNLNNDMRQTIKKVWGAYCKYKQEYNYALNLEHVRDDYAMEEALNEHLRIKWNNNVSICGIKILRLID